MIFIILLLKLLNKIISLLLRLEEILSGDYSGSGGGSYSLENSWPKQLRVSTTGQTFKIVYYNSGFMKKE